MDHILSYQSKSYFHLTFCMFKSIFYFFKYNCSTFRTNMLITFVRINL